MTGMRARLTVYLAALVLAGSAAALVAQDKGSRGGNDKINLALRLTPTISFSPARVQAIAELKGVPAPEREAQLYCASVEWDWDDGTRSEFSYDCEPYEEGRSELRRRFTAEHTYQQAGRYRVQVRLKRNGRVLLMTNSLLQVRPGIRDWGE